MVFWDACIIDVFQLFIVSKVLISMKCRCGDINALHCTCCQQDFPVKLAGMSSSVTGYDRLYNSTVDIWSFGYLLLTIFMGKCGISTEGNACEV